jgi:hypothetical protein
MFILTDIVGKLLVIVDQVLSAFATNAGAVTAGLPAACNFNMYNYELTPCGQALIVQLQTLIFEGLAVVTALMGGLLAQ